VTDEEVWAAGGSVLDVAFSHEHSRVRFHAWAEDNLDEVAEANASRMTVRSKGGGVVLFVTRDCDPRRLMCLCLDRIRGEFFADPYVSEIARSKLRGKFASVARS
jgi:hypothetical protein